MWVCFACLRTQHIFCSRLMLGFWPLQHYYGIGIDKYCDFRDHGENFGFTPLNLPWSTPESLQLG